MTFVRPFCPLYIALLLLMLAPETHAQEKNATVVQEVPLSPPPEQAPTAESPTAAQDGQKPFLHWLGEELNTPQREREEALQNEVMVMRQEMMKVQEEMSGMRKELGDLRETLDILVNQVIQDLRDENESLKKRQVKQDRAAQLSGMDSQELREEVHKSVGTPPPPPEEQGEPQPLQVEVVEEWGRSQEDAAALGGKVKTLKGIIGVVPAGADQVSLAQLGRDLRQQYNLYDNINVEIFDDRAAAEGYQGKQVQNPRHRVLSVTKHLESGRDAIVVYPNGIAREVQ